MDTWYRMQECAVHVGRKDVGGDLNFRVKPQQHFHSFDEGLKIHIN